MTISEVHAITPTELTEPTSPLVDMFLSIFKKLWFNLKPMKFKDNGSFRDLFEVQNENQSRNIRLGNETEKAFNIFLQELCRTGYFQDLEVITSNEQYERTDLHGESKSHHIQLTGKKGKTQIDLLLRLKSPGKKDIIYYFEMKNNVTLDTEKSISIRDIKLLKIKEYYEKDGNIVHVNVLCLGYSSWRSKDLVLRSKVGKVWGMLDFFEHFLGRKDGEEGDVKEFDDIIHGMGEIIRSNRPSSSELNAAEEQFYRLVSDEKERRMFTSHLRVPRGLNIDTPQIPTCTSMAIPYVTKYSVMEDDASKSYQFILPSDYSFSTFTMDDHRNFFSQFSKTKAKCTLTVGFSNFTGTLYSGGNASGPFIKGYSRKSFKGLPILLRRIEWDDRNFFNLEIRNF